MGTLTLITLWTGCAIPVFALQQEPDPDAEPKVSQTMTVVYQPEDFHDRSQSAVPVLVYQKEFFQRFEPLSVGDILKRIPGISGSADAGEFDLPQMRGIGPKYTQILINGERVPGAANDRTLAVDRIPAYLVERVEIIRSASPDGDAQGIGGTINIVLLEKPEGGIDLLMSGMQFDQNDKRRGQSAANYGLTRDGFSLSLTGTVQKRYNPKTQHTDIFDAEGDLVLKDETNLLDATETALNAFLSLDTAGSGLLEGRLFVLKDSRTETEGALFSEDGTLAAETFDHGRQRSDTWGAQVSFEWPFAASGSFNISLAHHDIKLDNRLDIGIREDGERVLKEWETDLTQDRESQLHAFVTSGAFAGHRFKAGIDLGYRHRDARVRQFENDEGETEEVTLGGVFRITEQRLDAYLMDTWQIGSHHTLQAGVRLESTSLDLRDAGVNLDEVELFPSLHYLLRLNDDNRLRFSVARTTARPDFMDLQPFLQRDQPSDGRNTRGNPDLRAEFALGFDLGYEHGFRDQEGVVGINLFYRDISDRVETVQVDDEDFQIRNAGDGRVYGLELDLGLPLTLLRLPNVSLFGNLIWQDSRLTDPHTGLQRPFNLQPDVTFNCGWLHSFPSAGLSYGVNWLSQGRALETLLTESSTIDYGDNLEMLLEKRWERSWSVRLTARNLLDAEKVVVLEEYDGFRLEEELNQTSLETERTGRSYLLTLRGAFGR